MLRKCDKVLPVSKFTLDRMTAINKLPKEQFVVLNNCLDPFLPEQLKEEKNQLLLDRYGFDKGDIVLMTLTRLSSKEKHKGYDIVIQSVLELIKDYPTLRYLIIGKYAEEEKLRLDELIERLELKNIVILAGFISDDELADYYNLADIFIMPSKKEGFGLVFIEALYYGKPVIAGNKDGSVDALYNGKFGILVDPDEQTEVNKAIEKIINDKEYYLPDKEMVMEKFGYSKYKKNIKGILENLYN